MFIETRNLNNRNTGVTLTAYILDSDINDYRDIVRPAVLVCPGGGFSFLSDREAEPMAMKFLAQGYNAFVLRYSINDEARFPNTLFDAVAAMLAINENAQKWHIDASKICVCGFSAGAHVAASLGVYWNHEIVKKEFEIKDISILKPNSMILAYPLLDIGTFTPKYFAEKKELAGIAKPGVKALFGTYSPTTTQLEETALYKHVTIDTPKAFIWHTIEDDIVDVCNPIDFAKAMSDSDVPYELHIFGSGGHGLGAVDKTTNMGHDMGEASRCSIWLDMAMAWLDINMPLEIK